MPPPRRIALVPPKLPDPDEPDGLELTVPPDVVDPPPDEPDEEDPLELVVGGAERTGCDWGGGADEVASLDEVRGMAWADAGAGDAINATDPPASTVISRRLYARIAFPRSYSVQLYCHPWMERKPVSLTPLLASPTDV